MRKHSLLSFVVLALTGCATTPIHYDGKTATYTHYDGNFAAAMIKAKEMCAKDGKGVKHDRSDCGQNAICISTFLCTEK